MEKPNNKSGFQSQQSSATVSSAHEQSSNHQAESEHSGIASMLSPRNIMKLFTKNVEEIVSPRVSLLLGTHHESTRYFSNITEEEVTAMFGMYLNNVSHEVSRYKNYHVKRMYAESTNDRNRKNREDIEQEVKISKIPEQYFQDWDHQLNQQELEQSKLDLNINMNEAEQQTVKHTHKSLKLQTLLAMGPSSSKKLSKQKKRSLLQKQLQLEQHLDEIQLIIYTKTQKYPDRYIHYLINLNDSDLEVTSLQRKVKDIRCKLKQVAEHVQGRFMRVGQLGNRKKKIEKILQIMKGMREIYEFRAQSKTSKQSDKISNSTTPLPLLSKQDRKCKKSSVELMKSIHEHSFSTQLQRINSIKATLSNMQLLGRAIRDKKFRQICKALQQNLLQSLSKMYSRQSWLKSELPKQALMIDRMKPQIQIQIQQEADDGQMNSSYLNISVLDQSYCVGASTSSKKQFTNSSDSSRGKQIAEMVAMWRDYCQEHCTRNKKLQEQEEQISEIFQRVTLKFVHTFIRDLEDYIGYIYVQKNIPVAALPPDLKTRMVYIHPKFYTKIVKLFFQSLSLIMRYSLDFCNLPGLNSKLLSTLQEQIKQIISLKQITEYAMIENKTIEYEDVMEVVTALDFWVQFAQSVADRVQMADGSDRLEDENEEEGEVVVELMIKFEESINQIKRKNMEQYFANLHQFALTYDLKQNIEKQDFLSISIPVNSFSILQTIINWGQHVNPDADSNLGKVNEIEQSFYLNSSMLADAPKKNKLFSIFKVIDRKLIIQGKQFKICRSILLLFVYLQTYLKAKVDFPALVASTDQRICELVGFYIWYCKKMIYSPVAQNQDFHQSMSNNSATKSINQHKQQQQITNPNLCKKTILNLCMLSNMCDLLWKVLEILNISVKPKKLEKVNADLRTIKQDAFKQISMIPFLESERQISCLYQSRLKTRKEIPTKQSVKLIEVLEQSRKDLSHYFDDSMVKKCLQNSVRIISKNYFGYLCNMEARGKAQLKWFMPKMKDNLQDIFPDDLANLEKHARG